MSEREEERELPKNLNDYLKGMREVVSVYKWILKELTTVDTKRWLKRVMLTLVIATALHLLEPWFMIYIYKGLIDEKDYEVIFGLAGYAIASVVFSRWANYFHSVAREWLLGLDWVQLDNRVTSLFFEKSMGQHIQESSKFNVTNIDKGRWKVLELQAKIFFEGVSALLNLFLSFVLLWILSPVSGVIMTTVIGIYLVWMLVLNQKVLEVCAPTDKKFRDLNRYRYDHMEKVERVKVSGRCEEELAEMNHRFIDLMDIERRFWIWYIKVTTFRGMINSLGQLAILCYGVWLVHKHVWSIAFLYPLVNWASQVCENIWKIGDIEHQLNWNMHSIRSMVNAVSTPPDIVDVPNAYELKSDEPIGIKFENVSHAYPKGIVDENNELTASASSVLRNVNFEVMPGEKVALLGVSGAGKTTIMRLLLRFMDPNEGRILINGHDLCDLRLVSWMQLLGYIPQQAQIFDGTIRYNITYALSPEERKRITDDEIWAVMRSLKIDFGARLSEGLDTIVGKNGIRLSGGEAQRLMIGAAAIKRPPFMLIDEATSSLDSSTERVVQDGLQMILTGDTSALVIAHRLSTVRNLCNKFIILRPIEEVNGDPSQIEAVGDSFEELFKISKTFRRLTADQGITI